jgi:hypothetical protein
MEKDSDRAIANLIASTRTKKRSVSLFEFYGWLNRAIKELGGLQSVADRISISTRMLKQFLVIDKLDKSVVDYVKTRELDSVDALNYLASFSHNDQRLLLPLLLEKKLPSKDLRSVHQQRSVLPNATIEELIERVKSGKSRRVYELQFVLRGGLTKNKISNCISEITGQNTIEAIEFDGPVGKIILTKEGLALLREYSRASGIPFKKVLSHLLYRQ